MAVLRSKARWASDKLIEINNSRRSPFSLTAQSTIINHLTLSKFVAGFTAGSSTIMEPADFPTHQLILNILNQQAIEQLLITFKTTTATACFKLA